MGHNSSTQKKKDTPMNPIADNHIILDGLYFSEDGNYGGGAIIIADHDAFTDEQMELLGTLSDNDRYDYAKAVLNGQDVSEWEN